jgi:hypothetical protein
MTRIDQDEINELLEDETEERVNPTDDDEVEEADEATQRP